jgi:peptidoglycan-associated lipoprotein
MREKVIRSLIVLAFVCSSLFIVSSCAKKQVQVSEPAVKAEEKGKIAAEEARAKAEAERQAKLSAEEAERQAKLRAEEAEREAKLREQETAKALGDEMRTFESEHIYFAFDKYDLLHYSQAVLKEKAAWLRRNESCGVWIEGHCDERGTSEYNLALGERRAHAAQEFLVALGISKDRIKTISYGEERPADPGHNDKAWAKNRRDEFKLFKTK